MVGRFELPIPSCLGNYPCNSICIRPGADSGARTHDILLGKQTFYHQAEMTLANAYSLAAKVMVENMLARDAEEGIGAFVEKRTPTWEDR